VLEEALAKGEQVGVDLLDGSHYRPEPETIAEAFKILHDGLDAVRVVLGGAKFQVLNDENGLMTLCCPDMPDILVQIREEPVPYEQREVQREFDGEARFNVLVSQDHLFGMDPSYDGSVKEDGRRDARPIADDLNDSSRERALSIRIDREGLVFDEHTGEVLIRDSMIEEAAATLDLGASIGDPSNVNVILGRALSAGNILLARQRATHPQYHHVRGVFGPDLGRKDRFAQGMRSLKAHLLGKGEPPLVSLAETPAA
jgi:hypothetical protein